MVPGAEEGAEEGPSEEACKRLPVGFVNNPVINLLWHDFDNIVKSGRQYELLKKEQQVHTLIVFLGLIKRIRQSKIQFLKLYRVLLLYTHQGQKQTYTNYLDEAEIKQIYDLGGGGTGDESGKSQGKKRKTRRNRVKNKRNTRKNQIKMNCFKCTVKTVPLM